MWGLLEEVEALCGPGRIRVLDIGGGLAVDYEQDVAAGQEDGARMFQVLAIPHPQACWQ